MSQLEREIDEVPARVAEAFAANAARIAAFVAAEGGQPPAALFTIGRGSSDAAASFAAYRFATDLGIPTGSLSPSLASVSGAQLRTGALWSLSISQSGKSEDIVRAQCAMAAGGAHTLALVNATDSPLARDAQLVLDQSAGPELSIAATKSVQASFALVDALVATLGGTDAAAMNAKLSRLLESPPVRASELGILTTAPGAFVLGRGATLGTALEAALKLKETAGLHAEAISAAEVMHGPKALAGPDLAVLALIGTGPLGASTRAAADQLEQLGCPTARLELDLDDPDADRLAPALLLQAFYRRLPDLARARGHDPDSPPHLAKVTSTR